MSEIIVSHAFSARQRLELAHGDITLETTDAIVNAANTLLQHGGGVAGAIVRRGGYSIQSESNKWVATHGPVTHSHPAVTSAGSLACKKIIHAVGPAWGEGDEVKKLAEAITGALITAGGLELRSIAIPPISTGIFGFPVELAAPLFYQSISGYIKTIPGSSLELVRITIIDSTTLDIFLRFFPTKQEDHHE